MKDARLIENVVLWTRQSFHSYSPHRFLYDLVHLGVETTDLLVDYPSPSFAELCYVAPWKPNFGSF